MCVRLYVLLNHKGFEVQWCDGNKKIAWKVSLHSFSLYYDFPYTLTLSNVGKPSWSWIPMEHIHGHIQVSKEKLDFHHCLFMFSIKHEIGHFHVVVMQIRQRNVQKVWCTFKVVVLTFSLPSRCWMNGSLSPYSYTWHVLSHYIVQLMLKMIRATCRPLDQRILLYM